MPGPRAGKKRGREDAKGRRDDEGDERATPVAVKTQYSTSVTAAASSVRIEAAAEIKGSLTLASVVQGYQTQASIGRTEECKRIRKALTEQRGLAALLARCAEWRSQRVGVVKGTDRRDGKAKGGRKLRVGQFLEFWDAAGKSQTTNEDVHFFVENCLRPPSTVAAADAFLRQREYSKRKMLKESAREMQLLAKCRGESFFQLFVSKLDTVGVQMVTKDGLTYDAAGDIFSDVTLEGLHQAARKELGHTQISLSVVEPHAVGSMFDAVAALVEQETSWSRINAKASLLYSTVFVASAEQWAKYSSRCKSSWLTSHAWARACFIVELLSAVRRGTLVVMKAPDFSVTDGWQHAAQLLRQVSDMLASDASTAGKVKKARGGQARQEDDHGSSHGVRPSWAHAVELLPPDDQEALRRMSLAGIIKKSGSGTLSCDQEGNPAPVTRLIMDGSGKHAARIDLVATANSSTWAEHNIMLVPLTVDHFKQAASYNRLAQWIVHVVGGDDEPSGSPDTEDLKSTRAGGEGVIAQFLGKDKLVSTKQVKEERKVKEERNEEGSGGSGGESDAGSDEQEKDHRADNAGEMKVTRALERQSFQMCKRLEDLKLSMVKIAGDGHCLFHTLADLQNRDEGSRKFSQEDVRQIAVRYMQQHHDVFMNLFLGNTSEKEEDVQAQQNMFQEYLVGMSQGAYGTADQVNAVSMAWQRQIEIVQLNRVLPGGEFEMLWTYFPSRFLSMYPFQQTYKQGQEVWACTGEDTWNVCTVVQEDKTGESIQVCIKGSDDKVTLDQRWVRRLDGQDKKGWTPEGFDRTPFRLSFHEQEYLNVGHYHSLIKAARAARRSTDLPFAKDATPFLPARKTRPKKTDDELARPRGTEDKSEYEKKRDQRILLRQRVWMELQRALAQDGVSGKKEGKEPSAKDAGANDNGGADSVTHGVLGLSAHADRPLTNDTLVSLWHVGATTGDDIDIKGPSMIFWTGSQKLNAANYQDHGAQCAPKIAYKKKGEVLVFSSKTVHCAPPEIDKRLEDWEGGSWNSLHMVIQPLVKQDGNAKPDADALAALEVDVDTGEQLFVQLLCPTCNKNPIHTCGCTYAKWTKSDISFHPSLELQRVMPHVGDSADARVLHAEALEARGPFAEVPLVRSTHQGRERCKKKARHVDDVPHVTEPLVEQILWHCERGGGVVRVLEAEFCAATGVKVEEVKQHVRSSLIDARAKLTGVKFNHNLFPDPVQGDHKLPVLSRQGQYTAQTVHKLKKQAWCGKCATLPAELPAETPSTGAFGQMSAAVLYDPPQPAAEIFTCTRQHVSLDTAMSRGRSNVGRGLMLMSRQLSEAFHTARCVAAGTQAQKSNDLILAPGSACSVLHACIAELGSRPSKGEGKAGVRRKTTRGKGILSGLNAMTRAQRDHHATVSMHVPCSDQCLIPECAKLQIDWVEIRRSALIPGECGLSGNVQVTPTSLSRFLRSEMTPPARMSQHCDTRHCVCNNVKAGPKAGTGHLFLPTKLIYMLAIYSPEKAANREQAGETMKMREYRQLEEWRAHFLHRKTDTRQQLEKGERAQYDDDHWRKIQSVTLGACRWQLRAPVCVAGTISSVQEDYVTETGICLAPAVNATTTHVVLEIDRSRMTFSERNVELSFADVMELRDQAVSQLDT